MRTNILGIDAGAVSVSLVQLDAAGAVVSHFYRFHHGHVAETLLSALGELDLARVGWVACTTSTPDTVLAAARFDPRVAIIAAARRLHPRFGALLTVGGEQFALMRFDAQGNYVDSHANTSCAAGTGSFLDEQARNLGFEGSAALAEAALSSEVEPPKIASRCAVFAKTDLIHAQQQGHSRAAIADGLCRGLATTIVDTVLSGEPVAPPIVLCGGVALNRAVAGHLAELIGAELVVGEYPELYGALGAAVLLEAQLRGRSEPPVPSNVSRPDDVVKLRDEARSYEYAPLELALSSYPDFASLERYEHVPELVADAVPVEVDIYVQPARGASSACTLGFDIGSTSTKAVLLDEARQVVAGFYTRTSGRPLAAVQAICEAVSVWATRTGVALVVKGAGTTGSGRKFIAAILGADLVVDEITAHARAAYELDPEVDTIIEIGGQDAKFTRLKDGMVTSAVMNTVCAAGTGSFIEEQARRLRVPVTRCAATVAGHQAPLASDRCTVFMQRDINHFTGKGYDVGETLSAVMHAVRENYLRKVAPEGGIGDHVCFQGATAKNRALVAAFEQKLQKPIRVSPYCHLTGGLGVALLLAEKPPVTTAFKGLELYREQLPLRREICELCANHCKLLLADVRGETAAYGFLCGRDYDMQSFVSNNRSGFDLLKARRRVAPGGAASPRRHDVTIGIPPGLHLFDDLDLWRVFFDELGVKTVTSLGKTDIVRTGRTVSRAEFCAPMVAFQGAAIELAKKVDWLFMPVTLESVERERDERRQHCYYTQFAVSLVPTLAGGAHEARCITPLLKHGLGSLQLKLQLLQALKPALGDDLGFSEVATAYDHAVEAKRAGGERLREVFEQETKKLDDVAVVLLGRPYTVLSSSMNKGIPDILASQGVKTFFQDMVPHDKADLAAIAPLLKAVHWHHAALVLAAAHVIASRPGLYPVFVTSFKCAPDSCIVDLVRRIFETHGKPYLVLQLDDHDSSIGYETRIEAAVRAFRNHAREAEAKAPVRAPAAVVPTTETSMADKTVIFPRWDRLGGELLVANLRREGIDARLVHEDEQSIRRSLSRNTGQCLPINAMAQAAVDMIEREGLDPARCVVWCPSSAISCNIGFYPQVLQTFLSSYGPRAAGTRVYVGEMTMIDVSTRAAINAYFAYMLGGMLRRLGCKVRPYELVPGAADRAVEQGLVDLRAAFLGERDKLDALRDVVARFRAIPVARRERPKVAIFGDLYVRDNEVFNQDLVGTIEQHGGEVVTTPFNEYMKIIADLYFRKWLREGRYVEVLKSSSLLATVKMLERKYVSELETVLGPRRQVEGRRPEDVLARFRVTPHHTGESFDNLLKVAHLSEQYPDLALLVQASPAFCCPGLVTEAMAQDIEKVTGIPVVSITYDGTAAFKNDALIPYLTFPRRLRQSGVSAEAS